MFRVPKEHDGKGVICPACHHLLNIPAKESQVPPVRLPGGDSPKSFVAEPRGKKTGKPIVARPLSERDTLPTHQVDVSQVPAADQRVRRRKSRPQGAPEWESASSRSGRGQGNPLAWIVGGSLFGLTLVGLGAWLVIGSVTDPDNDQGDLVETPAAGLPVPFLVQEDEMNEEEKKRQQEIRDMVRTGMDAQAGAQDVVRKFLTAETIDELKPLVRNPDVAMPRIRRWYAENKWTPPGAKEIGCGGRISLKGKMTSMSVRLGDYSVKQIALERTPDGYKVDWESWVAWSSMPWNELFEKRPTEPVEVRVRCARDYYYNRLFSDDKKWQAVRLENPDSEKTIYGYIDRGSPLMTRLLGSLRGRSSVMVTVAIRYPEDSVANNQVYVSEYLHSGWVSRAGSKPPVPDAPTK